MRFCEQVRRSAAALIARALAAARATVAADVSDHADTPVTAGKTAHILIRADDRKTAVAAGTAPSFQTAVALQIALRVCGISEEDAQGRMDALIELIETALLGGQGWSLTLTLTKDSQTATPATMDDLAKGLALSGTGLGSGNYITATDSTAGTITLKSAATASGSYVCLAGSFVGLFEQIDSMDGTADYDGKSGAYHIWTADLSLTGHVTEIFEPDADTDLSGVAITITSGAADALELELSDED